jgi:hypothetical protein
VTEGSVTADERARAERRTKGMELRNGVKERKAIEEYKQGMSVCDERVTSICYTHASTPSMNSSMIPRIMLLPNRFGWKHQIALNDA